MPITPQEINRKLFHMVALLLPAGIFYFPMIFGFPQTMVPFVLAFLLLCISLMEILRLRYPKINTTFQKYFRSMLRQEEKRTITGSSWLIASALVCALLFRGEPHISFICLTLFILGDAGAAIVGQSVGKIKMGSKTFEGSLACFVICTGMFLMFPHLPFLTDVWGGNIPPRLIFLTSLAVTFFELVPLKIPIWQDRKSDFIAINDNLSVPIITGFVISWLQPPGLYP